MVPPCGTIVGEIELKVMGPPWMMVMDAVEKRVVSALAVATMLSVEGVVTVGWAVVDAGVVTVGTVAGAT